MGSTLQDRLNVEAVLESQLSALESEMPNLQLRAMNVFELARSWADRHDAIIASTPADLLGQVEARLRRIGIRWGMVSGMRMTGQFPALPPQDPDDEA